MDERTVTNETHRPTTDNTSENMTEDTDEDPEAAEIDGTDGDQHGKRTDYDYDATDTPSTVPPETTETVTMEVTVDARDLTDTQQRALTALARQFEDAYLELVEKNRDYGWSYLETAKEMADNEDAPVDTLVRSTTYGLLTREGDKRKRLMKNLFGNGSSRVSDPPAVTAREAANYQHLVALALEHPELMHTLVEE